MKKNSFIRFPFPTLILLAVSLIILPAACSSTEPQQEEGPTDSCGLVEPTDAEVQHALSYGKAAFTPKDWIKRYAVEPYKVSVTRKNDAEGAVAYTEYLIFNCGYGQAEMNDYFNDEGFDIIFNDYESHTLAGFCKEKSLALYEFDLVEEGSPYIARYWVYQEDDHHILVMMLVFPQTSLAKLDQFSQKIFPELSICK